MASAQVVALYPIRGSAPLLCPEDGCGEELEIELAQDVALDFLPLGEPYVTLVRLGGQEVWHCWGCGYVAVPDRGPAQ